LKTKITYFFAFNRTLRDLATNTFFGCFPMQRKQKENVKKMLVIMMIFGDNVKALEIIISNAIFDISAILK
jgi:hypothetical protein